MMFDTAKKALDLALKYTDCAEVYIEKERFVEIDIQKDKIDFAKEGFVFGIGIRVIQDGKMGFSYTTDLDHIKESVKNAIFNARCNRKDKNFAFSNPSKYPTVKNIYDKKIEVLELENSIEFANTMIDTAKEHKCQPTSGGFSAGYTKSLLMNSQDVSSENISTSFSGFLSVIAKGKGDVSTAYESDSSRYFDIDPQQIAKDASMVARDSLGGRVVKTKNMDVVLDYHAASGLLSTFVNALSADNVQRGRSVFAGKIGSEVVSSSLSMYDDGTLERGLNSSMSDGEGTPTQRTSVVEDGVLKNFLYDIYTSKKDDVASTGNGIRSSFADTPSVGVSNFILEFDDVLEISDINEGFLVTDVMGAHTSNPMSGDFSVETRNAFKIEQGEIAYPIKKAMLSGNIFQSMNNAFAISKRIRQIGPFIIPRILIHDLRVVG